MLINEMGLMQKANKEMLERSLPTPLKGKESVYKSDMNKFLNEMQEIM